MSGLPSGTQINAFKPGLSAAMTAVGYDLSDVLTAFQRRYRPSRFDGWFDPETSIPIRARAGCRKTRFRGIGAEVFRNRGHMAVFARRK